MKWFYNLKVSAKLLIGFLTVAVIAAVIGIVGVVNIKNIDNADTQLYEQNVRGLEYAGNADVYFQRIRVNSFKMIMYSDSEERTKFMDKISSYFEKVDEYAQKYEKETLTEGDKAIFAETKSAWQKYKAEIQSAMDMIKEGKDAEAKDQVMVKTAATIDSVQESFDKLFIYNSSAAKEKSDSNEDAANSAITTMIVIILIGVLVAISLGIFISQIISKPLKNMTDAAQKLALGDVNVRIEATTKDEIGNLMHAFSKMVENIREQAYATEKIAAGDMTVQVKVKSENDLMGIKLTEMIKTNNEVLGTISSAAAQVAAGARQVSASSQMLSQGSTEQASSIEEVTVSMTQVADQTKKNAVNANQANELALSAKENALKGNSQMQEMIKAMTEINDSSASISKIIKVIDDIAFQTNILALNAAVEAARAGQHGKGFAVVADEVRNLAARSANAAKETTELIENSIKKVEAGSQIANNTAQALNEIVDGVAKAADLVGNIASASNEQASGIAQINQAISQVAQVVQTNSATAEESASASEELSSQADLLKESVSRFKLKKARGNMEIEGLDSDTIRAIEDIVDKKKSHRNFEQYDSYMGEDVPVKSNLKNTISLEDNNFGKY
ncbi:methyl-accepting chemotaxis protein [Acetivibrio cellulolyticus]|uniref:methyl-accepting chemotaxis protein n=1 Tax=Acetivibrio cellulolyticus TaxID=35830 RepID=UPI0001E301A8|nr:methyl-accepting chemotaxis protein [Acetivibrio cellulolyticus]